MSDDGYRIAWTTLALERVLEIAEFRFPYDADRARTWMGEVVDYADSLRTFPNRGRTVSASERENVRQLLFRDVWIIYEVLGDQVLILTVRHVRENPEDIE